MIIRHLTHLKTKIIPTISLAGDARMIPIKHMDFTISDANGKLKKGTKLRLMKIGRVVIVKNILYIMTIQVTEIL